MILLRPLHLYPFLMLVLHHSGILQGTMCVCKRSEQISIARSNTSRGRSPPPGLQRQPFVIIVATMLAFHLTGRRHVLCERIFKQGLPSNIKVIIVQFFTDYINIA